LLTADKSTAAFFEHTVSEIKMWAKDSSLNEDGKKKAVKLAVNYLNTDLRALLNETGTPLREMRITPENFAELTVLLAQSAITSAVGKAVLDDMFRTGKDPSHIVEEKGLLQVSDTAELEQIAKEIVSVNTKAVADFKSGNQNALQFFVGQLMAKTRGKADPALSREIFLKLLK